MPTSRQNIFSKLKHFNLVSHIAEFSPENHKYIVIGFMVVVIVLFFFSFGTKFDANMQNINYMTAEQRAEMDKLIEQNKGKSKKVYVVAEGKTPDEALENYARHIEYRLESYKYWNYGLESFSGIGHFVPTTEWQKSKIERWNKFWQNKKEKFTNDFQKISEKQGFNNGVFDNFIEILNKDYKTQNFNYFYNNLNNLIENYVSIEKDKTLIFNIIQCDSVQKVNLEREFNYDEERVKTYYADTNYMFSALPPPVDTPNIYTFDDTSITQKMVSALSDDFNKVLYICAFVVFVFLFFSFGKIELAILTFIPMAVGWVCILGLMNIFGLSFNIVNIILATFIFGQGDDYTIFVTEGLIYEYTYGKKMLAKFKTSIILSAAILFIAIGTLILAKHPAMRSLAELTIVGMISVVSCAYLLPPLIYRWLVYAKGKTRLMPITLWNLSKTIFAFVIFLLCSIIITLAGFFILTIGGKTKWKLEDGRWKIENGKKRKLLYHNILCKGFRILAKLMPQIKHKIHNPHGENFDKPAIIICNHQSHLDLLYTLLLSPKIITLTNKWVWKTPFYGQIIRYADFLPIADGLEQHADKLQKFVDNGYSILVFPEGTRSPDCKIGRFHKGAFYLAEKFGLDILPVIIHGVGHVFPKQEFILRKGEVNVVIEQRIKLEDRSWNMEEFSLLKISKKMRDFYQNRYEEIVKQVETPEYFVDKLLKSYFYKGAGIERKVRKRLKDIRQIDVRYKTKDKRREIANPLSDNLLSNNLMSQNLLSNNLTFNDVVAAQLYALSHKDIRVIASDTDEDLLEVAKHCSINPENLEFK